MKINQLTFALIAFFSIGILASCSDDEHDHDHDHDGEETINRVTLTFTPEGSGSAVTATWFDEDGEGGNNPTIEDIDLIADTEYELSVTLTNTLGEEDEDVTAEIEMEDDEHQFFFAFTTDIFSDPMGNGNVDARTDGAVIYNDMDENSLPVGLSTQWTTGDATSSAAIFRVILKHQPGVKSATSTANDSGSDIDVTFDISISDPQIMATR